VIYKAISLWQPWASLVAIGAKKFETRHWSTGYRGLLAIHAAKRWTRDEQRFTWEMSQKYPELREYFLSERNLVKKPPLGVMLCIVRLEYIVQTNPNEWVGRLPEYDFGNYSPGRFAWKLELVEVFDKPIPARGAQGFFQWERSAS
jgi:activating signal cointegrator 1